MQIDMHGAMTPCCFNEHNGKFGNLQDYASLQDAHNNRAFVQLRTAMAKGDYKAAGCSSCKLVKVNGYGVKPEVADIAKLEAQPTLDAADANRLQNLKECAAGATTLSSLPCNFTITVSHKCNIDCFMCWQRDEHGNYDQAELRDDVVAKLEGIYRTASNLHWVGGEPFALRPVHQFISNFNTEHTPNLRLMATTNALLLKSSVLEKLARFKNVSLVLSIDGVSKETYEYIRTGGKWETLLEVLPELSKVAAERGWSVCINYVVMVSNIHELPAAVQFAKKLKFMIAFDPVSGARLTTENFFQYPELIQKVPDWRKHIDEAIRAAEDTDGTEWRMTGAGTAGDNTSAPTERFRNNVKQRLEYIRSLLTDGETRARTPAPKRFFFPLNLILK
jgi:MoaA/NifB/PqqE/SkfB family radical SAM enzyme